MLSTKEWVQLVENLGISRDYQKAQLIKYLKQQEKTTAQEIIGLLKPTTMGVWWISSIDLEQIKKKYI